MISYAQNFEDAILWQALSHIETGFYVDVGAGHPENLSVTRAFYDRGWHGINIEPNGEMYALLLHQRPRDINLCACAGPKNGSETFLYYDRGVGIVANDPRIREIFERHGHKGHETALGQITLNSVFTEFQAPDAIHFLKIDVEGYELQVLEGLDLGRWRPWIIVAEASLPTTDKRTDQAWNPRLLSNYYQFVYFDGLNCFYVAAEKAKALRTSWRL